METQAKKDNVAAIEFRELSKSYGGGILALDSLRLIVPRGNVFGFLGPNGAGKTTAIRLMLDLIRPTSGGVRVFGEDCNGGTPEVRRRIGYLPGDLRLYPALTGEETLALFTSLRPGQVGGPHVRELVERLDVDMRVRTVELSHGSRQKVGLVLALMGEPDLVVLDEPTSGLDPLAQRQVLDIVREIRRRGGTVFFSSHNLSEVEQICDRVAMIRHGRLIATERVDELTSRKVVRILLTFSTSPPRSSFASVHGVREIERSGDGRVVRFEVSGEADGLVKAASQYQVVAVETEQPSLEEAFVALYEGNANGAKGG